MTSSRVIPAKAGTQSETNKAVASRRPSLRRAPAFAGVTEIQDV